MSNVVTDFRLALVAALETSFPTADVRSGARTGVWRGPDKDLIHVFFAGYEVDPARVVIGKPVMIVRYWKVNPETTSSTSPQDPTPLEQGALDLLVALRGVQTLSSIASHRPWFFIVEYVRTDEDPAEWGIEAKLTGFTANVATIA